MSPGCWMGTLGRPYDHRCMPRTDRPHLELIDEEGASQLSVRGRLAHRREVSEGFDEVRIRHETGRTPAGELPHHATHRGVQIEQLLVPLFAADADAVRRIETEDAGRHPL